MGQHEEHRAEAGPETPASGEHEPTDVDGPMVGWWMVERGSVGALLPAQPPVVDHPPPEQHHGRAEQEARGQRVSGRHLVRDPSPRDQHAEREEPDHGRDPGTKAASHAAGTLTGGVGAGEGTRTPGLLITSELLCRLSYPGDYPQREVQVTSPA